MDEVGSGHEESEEVAAAVGGNGGGTGRHDRDRDGLGIGAGRTQKLDGGAPDALTLPSLTNGRFGSIRALATAADDTPPEAAHAQTTWRLARAACARDVADASASLEVRKGDREVYTRDMALHQHLTPNT